MSNANDLLLIQTQGGWDIEFNCAKTGEIHCESHIYKDASEGGPGTLHQQWYLSFCGWYDVSVTYYHYETKNEAMTQNKTKDYSGGSIVNISGKPLPFNSEYFYSRKKRETQEEGPGAGKLNTYESLEVLWDDSYFQPYLVDESGSLIAEATKTIVFLFSTGHTIEVTATVKTSPKSGNYIFYSETNGYKTVSALGGKTVQARIIA